MWMMADVLLLDDYVKPMFSIKHEGFPSARVEPEANTIQWVDRRGELWKDTMVLLPNVGGSF